MNKIKSISRFITTYDRTNTYDDTIEETKRMLSYMEYDSHGNLCCDKTYNVQGECENIIKRVYNEKNQITEESFYDGIEDIPYESRKYKFDERGLPFECNVKYSEETVIEKFTYSDDGKLLEKEVVYPDGYAFIENKNIWENGLLVDEIEFDDEDSMSIRKKYWYDEKAILIELELHEISQNNKISEKYEYNDFGITRQTTYNYKGDVMTTRTFSYDEAGLVVERIIETMSQYFKYKFEYNDRKLPVVESMLNHEDLVLTKREMSYNDDNEEISANVYSLNILENNDEFILVESYTTEFAYF